MYRIAVLLGDVSLSLFVVVVAAVAVVLLFAYV